MNITNQSKLRNNIKYLAHSDGDWSQTGCASRMHLHKRTTAASYLEMNSWSEAWWLCCSLCKLNLGTSRMCIFPCNTFIWPLHRSVLYHLWQYTDNWLILYWDYVFIFGFVCLQLMRQHRPHSFLQVLVELYDNTALTFDAIVNLVQVKINSDNNKSMVTCS